MEKICIVGDILNDVTLKTSQSDLKMRLGGIVHAARALWAMNVEYDVAYFAPEYLDLHIKKYLAEFKCTNVIKLGNVRNMPYTMLIGEAKEIGDQQYDFLLKDDGADIDYYFDNIKQLRQYDKMFFISGNYEFSVLDSYLSPSTRLYGDIANNITSIEEINCTKKHEIIFLSTSSDLFKQEYSTFYDFVNRFSSVANKVVLKENRGGSRAIDFSNSQIYHIPSQTQPVTHSVGVGDVYDIVTVMLHDDDFKNALYKGSWIASEYATTTFPDNFKRRVQATLQIPLDELVSMGGCQLPWERRKQCNIYIAAPDFDFVDKTHIDQLANSLMYHNFTPRRPIEENGQMKLKPTSAEKAELFNKDMRMLDDCSLLVAVILYDDPGTYIEIGLAAQRGIPTIVYDPFERASNCMLTELPNLVSSNLDEVISEVFNLYSKRYKNEIE